MHHLLQSFLKRDTLRTKMLLATLLVVVSFMLGNMIFMWVSQGSLAHTLAQGFSENILNKTYSAFIYPMSLGDTETVVKELNQTGKTMQGLRIYISDLNQSVRFASEESWRGTRLSDHLKGRATLKAIAEALDKGKVPSRQFFDEIEGEKYLVTIRPLRNKAPSAQAAAPAEAAGMTASEDMQSVEGNESCYHCHGEKRRILGAMVMAWPLAKVNSELWHTGIWTFIISFLAMGILIVVFYIVFSFMVTQRLGALQAKTELVAEGDVSVTVYDESYDSIGRLARDFNRMVTSIRDRMEFADSLKLGISDPFFMTDPQRRITFVNTAALSMTGKREDEALGRMAHEVFLTDEFREQCPVKRALETGEPIVGQRAALPGRRGRETPIICSAAILKDSSGTILGAFEIMRDLSVEVEAERRLRDSYAREEKAKQSLEQKVLELSQVLEKVSQGDLTLRAVPEGSNDSMDILTHRINETLEGMQALLLQVKHAILPVTNGVMRISRENQSLAQRTEQQAAAMEEISATLEELVSTTSENLANTRHADALSKDAVKAAHDGGDQVVKTAQSMAQMELASHKVVEMMDLINEITFQTKLLSINAAVEAAHAGEQGRGFAVVANEIRNLANRSASAAKDIQSLVREIVDKVSSGRLWVAELEQCFSKIVAHSTQVSEALGEVTMGSEESSRGIEQINQGTQEVCEVNEKNASFVDELAQETQKLKEKSRQLQEITSVFVLGAKDVFEPERTEKPAVADPRRERRRAKPVNRALREDLVRKSDMEDMPDDILEKEFEEGFEEF